MSEAKDTVVHLDNISKHFGRAVAIDTLDMKINAGEFVTFLGPSGCGKTTTLRIVGGFEQPTHGRVVLGGEDVTPLPPNKRRVNMVFQDYALFPHMTVAQNVSFGLELKGMSRVDIDQRLAELLAFLEIDAFRQRMPEQLSGGQRQRVALARALAPDPDLLLLDEPLGALDAKLRAQVQVELKAIQRRTGKTFFFVTHDQDEALTMSDRIVVMNHGRVEQDGTPEQLYQRPASRFVAEFIGESNLLDGKVLEVDNGVITVDCYGIPLRGRASGDNPRPGDKVTVALRPERIKFYREQPDQPNALIGNIDNRAFKGSRIAVDVSVADNRSAQFKAYVDSDLAGQLSGDQHWIGWDDNSMVVLRD